MTKLSGGAATDVGRVRQINEDRYLVGEGLYAVADGVGGHQAGEVAAENAVEALATNFTTRSTSGLIEAIKEANRAVWRLAQGNAERRGMGTTLTAAALVQENGEEQLAIANVGDSRAYLFQHGDLVQVTEDHSLVEELVREGQLTAEEAQVHPQRSIITRALGMEPEIEVDAWTLTPYSGDRIVLCSDGLTNEVTSERIASTLRQLADPQEVAQELVRQARAHGGNDNITVVVVDVVDDGGRAEKASAALAGSETGTARNPVLPLTPPPDDVADEPAAAPARTGPGTNATATATRTRPPVTAAPPESKKPKKPKKPKTRDRPRRFTWRVAIFLIALAAVLVTVVASVAWYARSAYFVGLDGDQVAIFRGRPGGFLWFDPTLIEHKPLTVNDILPAKVQDLRAGKEEPSKADADRYVNNLRQEAAQRQAATSTTTTPPPPGQPPGPTTSSTRPAPA